MSLQKQIKKNAKNTNLQFWPDGMFSKPSRGIIMEN